MIAGIDRLEVILNKNLNSVFSTSIKDRFETTLSYDCPIAGF